MKKLTTVLEITLSVLVSLLFVLGLVVINNSMVKAKTTNTPVATVATVAEPTPVPEETEKVSILDTDIPKTSDPEACKGFYEFLEFDLESNYSYDYDLSSVYPGSDNVTYHVEFGTYDDVIALAESDTLVSTAKDLAYSLKEDVETSVQKAVDSGYSVPSDFTGEINLDCIYVSSDSYENLIGCYYTHSDYYRFEIGDYTIFSPLF